MQSVQGNSPKMLDRYDFELHDFQRFRFQSREFQKDRELGSPSRSEREKNGGAGNVCGGPMLVSSPLE